MIARTLSHYKILEKIGEGGTGDVYLTKDTSLDRTVAMKVLLPNHLRSTLGLVLSGLLGVVTACFVQQSRWTPKADMPTPRWSLSTSAVAGTVYAIGGFERGFVPSRTVEAYDPKTNTWTKKADMPTPRSFLATSTVDGRIYAVGGANLELGQLGLPTVEEYDPMTDTWTQRADMPTPRHALSTCVLDGKIYAVSGFDGTNLATVEQYDPSSDTWTTKADLPTIRSHLATQTVGGKIYAIGGWDRRDGQHTAFSSVAVYDPATDTWTRGADMPTPRWSPASGLINGKIYIIGGNAAGTGDRHNNLQTVEVYDPETDTWIGEVDMPTARGWLSSSVVDGKLYAIGGGLSSQSGTSELMVLATVEELVVPSPE